MAALIYLAFRFLHNMYLVKFHSFRTGPRLGAAVDMRKYTLMMVPGDIFMRNYIGIIKT
jgi:hypothetical protein